VLVGEGTPAPDVTAVVEETPTPRVVVDPGRGIAAVRLEGTRGASVPLGRSHDLRPGDELIFASGAGDPVVVRFVGQATVRLGTSILSQLLLDLELAAGGTPSQGAVLDRQGRLVGIVVPERQTGAPLGHVYAVPVEQTADLLSRIGAATG
jgi:S1-C subfamily serine protease